MAVLLEHEPAHAALAVHEHRRADGLVLRFSPLFLFENERNSEFGILDFVFEAKSAFYFSAAKMHYEVVDDTELIKDPFRTMDRLKDQRRVQETLGLKEV